MKKGSKHTEKWKREQSQRKMGHLVTPETRSKISQNNAKFWLGKKRPPISEEQKERQRIKILGRKHSQETKLKMSLSHIGKNTWSKGRKLSEEHKIKIALAHLGEKSHLWKGGTTPLNQLVRTSYKYKDWRNKVFLRDGFTCVNCGYDKGGIIEADHITRLADLLRELNVKTIDQALRCEKIWDMNNGQTLCAPCHKRTDTWGYKSKDKR